MKYLTSSKASCLEASLFSRYRVNYRVRNRPKKFRVFRETPPGGPFLETHDNFLGQVGIFASSLICQVMGIICANLAIRFTKL